MSKKDAYNNHLINSKNISKASWDIIRQETENIKDNCVNECPISLETFNLFFIT